MGPVSPEESILDEAYDLVHGARGADYGKPWDDFSRTALMWTAMFERPFKAHEVALAMICVKLSRQMNADKRDNLVDIAGYAETCDLVLRHFEQISAGLQDTRASDRQADWPDELADDGGEPWTMQR